jgi:methanogenic corrinoid protein MtbC1
MGNNSLLDQIITCVEFGKVDRDSPFPPNMKGMEGADELTRQAIEAGIKPSDILDHSLIIAMDRVGEKFSQKKIFVPQMLMSAKAMNAALVHLKPYFQSGEVTRKGKLIIGTVAGDLHDIGKNLVSMIVEGAGWEVIDLGVDVNSAKFISCLKENPGAIVGLSALLTTTMVSMKQIAADIKKDFPNTKVIIGGAPVNENFRVEIGVDGYSRDPQGAVQVLNSLVA